MILITIHSTHRFNIVLCLFPFAHIFLFIFKCYLAFREASVRTVEFIAILITGTQEQQNSLCEAFSWMAAIPWFLLL